MSARLRLPRFLRTTTGFLGVLILVPLLALICLGPLIAPDSISEIVGLPGLPPQEHGPLGTDVLGRDVYSRILSGGRSVLLLGVFATIIAYFVGLVVGLIAGYTRSLLDPLLMRGIDVVIAIPGLVLVLLLVAGFGASTPVMIVGITLINLPGIARLIRTATLENATRGYVEAAVARGERAPSVLTREILPNLTTLVLADIGVRFGYTVAFIASLNYLGLGVRPPSADWALMVSENRNILESNIWAVLVPAILLALLVTGVNLLADAYVQVVSGGDRRRLRLPRSTPMSISDTDV